MKKLIIYLMILVCMTASAGCGNKSSDSFLTSSDYWWFYDEVTGEYEKMSFRDDGTFYWGCECGEPVGDSDMYELYDFDSESQSITLYNEFDNTSMEMKVIDYSDCHLLLEQNGKIKDYTCENLGIYVDNSEAYFPGYSMYSFIKDGNGEAVVLGPFNYDGDIEYPENAFKTYPLAEDIVFCELQVKKTVYDDGGEYCEITYEELSREEGIELSESGAGFIWLNDDMEIEKITYYGEIINWV